VPHEGVGVLLTIRTAYGVTERAAADHGVEELEYVELSIDEARRLRDELDRAIATESPGPVAVPDPCDCDLRDRRWNPNTGRCESCRRAYRERR
jgi:hypothetical protein